ncbi:helix-turn-helix domain-containing protein, partial [Streptomyces sp. GXMU-J5]|nr:helix-turn-helix domain-containing protein [Streptomyces beihaiensis]
MLAVLSAFDHSRPALSLSAIARRAALPLATGHRLVGELAAWGALERDASGLYHVGPKVRELAALAPRPPTPHGPALREAALPCLTDLSEATGARAQLAVREGRYAVCVLAVPGGAAGTRTPGGARTLLPATAAGRVLLAARAASERQLTDDVLSVAAPVFGPLGDVVAAVAVVAAAQGVRPH